MRATQTKHPFPSFVFRAKVVTAITPMVETVVNDIVGTVGANVDGNHDANHDSIFLLGVLLHAVVVVNSGVCGRATIDFG